MKNQKLDLARNVLISRSHWDVPVRVQLRRYLQFSGNLDDQLQKLVDQWIHTAAPNARGWRGRNK